MTEKQNATPLFSEPGLIALRSFVDRETLFAFDLDGTLAPIIDNPEGIHVSEATRKELERLTQQAAVAIITGRSRNDARVHLGVTPRFLIGNHGAEGLPGREESEREFVITCLDWEHQLEGTLLAKDIPGIFVENKGTTLSVHYRAAAMRRRARTAILGAVGMLIPRPRRVGGKCVENLLPVSAPDKGSAMLCLMETLQCQKGFYVGDDVTDEDVFKQGGNNLFTVRVGTVKSTHARYRLQNQRKIADLIAELNGILAARE